MFETIQSGGFLGAISNLTFDLAESLLTVTVKAGQLILFENTIKYFAKKVINLLNKRFATSEG